VFLVIGARFGKLNEEHNKVRKKQVRGLISLSCCSRSLNTQSSILFPSHSSALLCMDYTSHSLVRGPKRKIPMNRELNHYISAHNVVLARGKITVSVMVQC
jgi:hypothetical protein